MAALNPLDNRSEQSGHNPLEQPLKKSRPRESSDVYGDAFLAEWLLLSQYCAEDFGGRFLWPEVGPEARSHFVGH